MSLFQFVAGKPLATSEERAEHIGPISGIPVFGLDALSSAAYGPEAAPPFSFRSERRGSLTSYLSASRLSRFW